MAFKVPKWEDAVPAVEFKPFTSSNGESKSKAKKPKKKKPKKPKEKRSEPATTIKGPFRPGRGPLAPPPDSSDDDADEEMRAMHKVRMGRIEKQRLANQNQITKGKQKKELQAIKLKPELAKAAIEAMDTAPAPTNGTNSAPSNKYQAELLGGRFRYINEQLYTMKSDKAASLFTNDNTAFEAYHAGYRQQVEKWPTNPLNRIIKTIKRLSKTAIIGDFGCGEGILAKSVPNKVYSMDLVSTRSDIIACNITATPLEAGSLDIAVYCLSLMGTNLNDYFLEANRVLKLHGSVYIAEIQSRFEDVREFVRAMKACGFDMIKKDVAVNYFYFFHFKKMRLVRKGTKLTPFSLKPCLYRKR